MNMNLLMTDQEKKLLQMKKKKFQKFVDEDIAPEFPELDILLTGDFNSQVPAEMLPSLLTTFLLTSDPELQDNIIDILRKQYN